jgi:hypothetical protein
MAVYFNLGHGTKSLAHSAKYPWPYDIDICFDAVRHPIAFSEGVGFGSVGCAVAATEALDQKWREHFEITKLLWLIPYIENLAQGIPLPRAEIIGRFRELHSRKPGSYESKFS